MHNINIIPRYQYSHLPNYLQTNQNKPRIQLTQTQNYSHLHQQKHHYSTVTGPFYQPKQQKQTANQKDRSFHSLQLKHSNPIQTNMHMLMKQQIDIAVANYQQKMGKVLKAQAQQLQRLSAMVAHNSKIIKKQNQIIQNIKKNEDLSTSSKACRTIMNQQLRSTTKSPSKISLTQRKSAKKMTNSNQTSLSPLKGQTQEKDNLEAKIVRLKHGLDEIQNRLKINSSQNKQILFKIYQLQLKMRGEIWTKLKSCQQSLQAFVACNQKKLTQIQKITETLNTKREIQNKLTILLEESKDLREQIKNISERQFTYESYQINKLKELLEKLLQQVQYHQHERKELSISDFRRQQSCLNQQSKQKSISKEVNALNYSQRIHTKSNLFLPHQELDRSQFSSISLYAPKYVQSKEDMVKRSQQWDESSQNNSGLSAEDQFFCDDIQTQTHVREEKLLRLQNILRKQGLIFPVRVEIDQTGYLKEYKTGMYILDDADNGFQLTQDEIKELRLRKVIY